MAEHLNALQDGSAMKALNLESGSRGDDDPAGSVSTDVTNAASTPTLLPIVISSPASSRLTSVRSPVPADLSDLDPFAPSIVSSVGSPRPSISAEAPLPSLPTTPARSTATLGSTMQQSSRLELLSDSDGSSSDSSPPPSLAPANSSILPDLVRGPASFIGTMFRSANGSGTPARALVDASDVSQEVKERKVELQEFNEKSAGAVQAPMDPNSRSTSPLSTLSAVFRSASARVIPSRPVNPAQDTTVGKGKGREPEVEREKPAPREEVVAVFDFNKFLEQMRTKSADPIAKYLRSFLKEFSRKPPVSTHDQIRVINDFLDFISGKMRLVDPWKAVLNGPDIEFGEAEFDMALEAMEKLVMNRVWHLTYTPAIDLSKLPGHSSPTDDLERDQVLHQRILLFSWISPRHLDLPLDSPDHPSTTQDRTAVDAETKSKERHSQGFIDFARRELNKINQYKAPRDKLICILNSCKVIFGLMRHAASDEGADSFIPFLIYIVLKANPEHLVSNIQYIQRFRNPEKLSGEGGYYLSSLNGAISFIETMDAASLSNITQAEFEDNVERAILALPIDPALRVASDSQPSTPSRALPPLNTTRAVSSPGGTDQDPDAASPLLLQQPNLSFPPLTATRDFFARSTESVERIVSKPLDAMGRIFDQLEGFADPPSQRPSEAHVEGYQDRGGQPVGRLRLSRSRSGGSGRPQSAYIDPHAGLYGMEGASAGQVTQDIDREHELQRRAALETLESMFPELEREVLEIILLSSGGDMSKTIDSLLDMS